MIRLHRNSISAEHREYLEQLPLVQEHRAAKKKIEKAAQQLNLLRRRQEEILVRYRRTEKQKNAVARHSLRVQLCVIDGVARMFDQYCTELNNKILHLQIDMVLEEIPWPLLV